MGRHYTFAVANLFFLRLFSTHARIFVFLCVVSSMVTIRLGKEFNHNRLSGFRFVKRSEVSEGYARSVDRRRTYAVNDQSSSFDGRCLLTRRVQMLNL